MPRPSSVEELLARGPMDESPELRLLFHRLNNQLGIILAHAELLEAKAADEIESRPRRAGRGERARRDGHGQRNSSHVQTEPIRSSHLASSITAKTVIHASNL